MSLIKQFHHTGRSYFSLPCQIIHWHFLRGFKSLEGLFLELSLLLGSMHNVVARLSLGIITAHGFLEVELLSATALWQFWWSAVLHDDLPGRIFLFWWRSFNTWNYYTRTLVTKKGWPKQQSSDWYTESRKQWLLIRASASTGQCCYLVPDSFPSWTKSNEQEFSKQGAQDCFSG